MKKIKLSFIGFLVLSGSLLAQEPTAADLADKIRVLEGRVSVLTSELAATQAKLREVSKIALIGRLELTVRIVSNGRMSLEGVGIAGEELGGKNLDGDEFVQKLESISYEYPAPIIKIANYDKLNEQERQLMKVLCGRAGIYITTAQQTKNAESGPRD